MGKCKGVGGVPCSGNEKRKGKGECYLCEKARVAADKKRKALNSKEGSASGKKKKMK